jgi:hypothetical protein
VGLSHGARRRLLSTRRPDSCRSRCSKTAAHEIRSLPDFCRDEHPWRHAHQTSADLHRLPPPTDAACTRSRRYILREAIAAESETRVSSTTADGPRASLPAASSSCADDVQSGLPSQTPPVFALRAKPPSPFGGGIAPLFTSASIPPRAPARRASADSPPGARCARSTPDDDRDRGSGFRCSRPSRLVRRSPCVLRRRR